eukprot:TRINITY_DN30681_c0_g1_i1.p1 TRINITY_DN30681_c0_g1~~TRINITY_DN30681_c0_g1_i1.p1  ORF type:complete len:596 (+),score=205.02 TRINITY_DN30681_c0_g1_i1:67-1854(+)
MRAFAFTALLAVPVAGSSGCRERFLEACPLGSELGTAECLRCLRRKAAALSGCGPAEGRKWCDSEAGESPKATSEKQPKSSEKAAKSSGSKKTGSPIRSDKKSVPVVPGDLLVVRATKRDGSKYLLASFHGDTNGLATIPVTDGIQRHLNAHAERSLVFGLDANTYGTPAKDQQGLQAYADWLGRHALATVWGVNPDKTKHTTYNARTYLQPQLNKAALITERESKGDRNLKDHIVFKSSEFKVESIVRDNTGDRQYEDDVVFPTLRFPSDHGVLTATLSGEKGKITVSTWNVAAINNNPFEYWITAGDDYNKMLKDVADFITTPGADDVPVSKVFTTEMFNAVTERLRAKGVSESQLGWLRGRWEKDLAVRNIITGFMKDGALGKKRLASMPDRVSNTITLKNRTLYRPTVINCYGGDLSTTDRWFARWLEFFFDESLDTGKNPVDILPTIKRSKYPAVTEEEEVHSKPLQLVAQGIFDAILVHMMNKLAPRWQSIRREMCTALNSGKDGRILRILERKYTDSDVIFLQEAAASLVDAAKAGSIGEQYQVVIPPGFDRNRNQNSVALLKRSTWEAETQDVTAAVMPDAAQSKHH